MSALKVVADCECSYDPGMDQDYDAMVTALRSVFLPLLPKLAVSTDTNDEFTVVTQKPSPFPQHKGSPLFFGSVRRGKAYVSLHLFPLYMCPEMKKDLPPELLKRMQGKTCFNFKTPPSEEQRVALCGLAAKGLRGFQNKGFA